MIRRIYMKRITSLILAAAMAAAFSVGCSDTSDSRSIHEERVSTNPIDPEIIGEWSNGTNGYIFSDDRTVSLPVDFTSSAHFNSDGSFSMESTRVDKDEIDYDGNFLSVSHHYDEVEEGGSQDILLLEMKHRDTGSKDSYDGEYDLLDGSYLDMLAYNLAIDKDKMNVIAFVDGENLRFTVEDYCSYETNDGVLELFSENMSYVNDAEDSVKYTYEIKGDTLTLIYEEGVQEVLQRVAE